jgi:hypothetical protein
MEQLSCRSTLQATVRFLQRALPPAVQSLNLAGDNRDDASPMTNWSAYVNLVSIHLPCSMEYHVILSTLFLIPATAICKHDLHMILQAEDFPPIIPLGNAEIYSDELNSDCRQRSWRID